MHSLKTVLLGTAAGFVAVAAAQAADLPVKAKPVEYVKVCSLYGAGFWYLPGTDTCLKIGARLTASMAYGATNGDGSVVGGYGNSTAAGQLRSDRAETNPLNFYWRAQTTLDFRTASEYGTVRSYMNVGFQQRTPQDTGIYVKNAFIQFAGFTAGRASSAFDFIDPTSYMFNNPRNVPNASIGGINVLTYTAQLGAGFSGSISLEDGGANSANYGEGVSNYFGPSLGGTGRGRPVQSVILANPLAGAAAPAAIGYGVGTGAFGVTPANPFGFIANPFGSVGAVTNNDGPNQVPDIVGNIRYDSPAFSAQVMGVLHQITADYYSTLAAPPQAFGSAFAAVPGAFASPACGAANANSPPSPGAVCSYNAHPDDAWGGAVGGGAVFKNVFGLKGDELALEGLYGKGATGYVTGSSQASIYKGGNRAAIFANANDAFFGSANATGGGASTQLNKTSGYSLFGVYQHYWLPTLRQSLAAGFNAYDVGAANKALICGGNGLFAAGNVAGVAPGLVQNQSTTTLAAGGAPAGTAFNCDPNWSTFNLGTKLEWLPMPLLRVGVEYWYNHLNTSFKGWANLAAAGARPAGLYQIEDADTHAVTLFIRKELLYP